MITQKDFESFYQTYIDYIKIQCPNVCNCNVQAVSTYVKRELNIDSCMWEITKLFVFDMYQNKLSVYEINGVQFVVFSWEQSTIKDKLGYTIESLNSCYNEPVKFKNDSFYNYRDDLIYYSSPKDFNRLLESYSQYHELSKQWDEFNKIKEQINEQSYLPCPPLIADHFLNCLPPVEFLRGVFLAGEAWNHNNKGQALYLEVRETSKNKYECKFSTQREFVDNYICKKKGVHV